MYIAIPVLQYCCSSSIGSVYHQLKSLDNFVNGLYISASHGDSTFDSAISGLIQPSTTLHTTEILGEICRILKPDGSLYICEPTSASSDKLKTKDKLCSSLKLSGFINLTEV